MKVIKYFSAFILASLLLTSCYKDYIADFDYTSVYFGTQKPLRTIVARDIMEFEVGVALAGMREDDGSYSVDFEVVPELLTAIPEAAGFTLLPESYYTLGDPSNFNIIKDHMRVVNVTLNREAFISDPASLTNTYALPLRITSANVDSIPGSNLETPTIASKDITILVVKYISPYHGSYYSKGMQIGLDAIGNPIDTLVYSKDYLSGNDVVDLSTLGANVVNTSRIGVNITGSLKYTMNNDGSVSVASDDVIIESGSTVAYDAIEKTYTLDLKVDRAGTKYHIIEEQILRQDPEADLRFEEW